MKKCEIDGCEKSVRTSAAAWCHMHYTRWWRHGDPLAVVAKQDRPRRQPYDAAAREMYGEFAYLNFPEVAHA